MIILLVLISFLFICYICYLREIYSYWRKKGVVGPMPWPVVGNYGQVLFRLKSESQLIKEIYNAYPGVKYIGIYMGVTPILIVNDMTMLKQVFLKDYQYFPNRYTSIALSELKESVFVGPTDKQWKDRRKILTLTVNQTRLRKYVIENAEKNLQDFMAYVDQLIEKRTEQDVLKLIRKNSFSIMCDVILGKRFGGLDEETEIEKQLRSVEELDSWELRYVLEGIFPHSVLKGLMVRIAKNIFGFPLKTMNSVISYRQHLKKQGTSEMNAIIDFVMEAQNSHNLDDKTVELHLGTLAVAVTATFSTVAAYFAFELAQNPEKQKKCYEEIRKVLEKHDGKITFEAIEEMKYFHMFLQDCLRKHGTSFVLDRVCATKYHFSGDNLIVDKGVRIYFPVDAIRCDPKYFPDSDKIVPERFAPENKDNLHPVAFTNFGYGVRHCIGKSLSQLLITMIFARLLQRFEIKPSERTPREYKMNPAFRVRRPLEGQMWLNIIRRKIYN